MKSYKNILNGLVSGKFNASDKVSNGRWSAKQGMNADGTKANFEVAAQVGGRYSIQVIESRFLSGLQTFAVFKRTCGFGRGLRRISRTSRCYP